MHFASLNKPLEGGSDSALKFGGELVGRQSRLDLVESIAVAALPSQDRGFACRPRQTGRPAGNRSQTPGRSARGDWEQLPTDL